MRERRLGLGQGPVHGGPLGHINRIGIYSKRWWWPGILWTQWQWREMDGFERYLGVEWIRLGDWLKEQWDEDNWVVLKGHVLGLPGGQRAASPRPKSWHNVSNRLSICLTAADRTSVHLDWHTCIVCHISLAFQVETRSRAKAQRWEMAWRGQWQRWGHLGDAAWMVCLKGRWILSQGQKSKGLERELERLSTLLKTWLHIPWFKGCIKHDK